MLFTNWYRPISQLPQQVALGINFVLGFEQGGAQSLVTRQQYKDACKAVGMPYMLQAPPDDDTLTAEINDPLCVGWDHSDEPNAGPPSTVPLEKLVAAYNRYASTGKLILMNDDGWPEEPWGTFDYKEATKLCNVFMFDFYVRNRLGAGVSIKDVMRAKLDRFKSYATNGQKFGFFVETDDQKLDRKYAPQGCGPTVADVQAYFDLAVEYNCDILGFFEDVIGSWFESYNSTSAEMYACIKENIAKLKTQMGHSTDPIKQRTATDIIMNTHGIAVVYDNHEVTRILRTV